MEDFLMTDKSEEDNPYEGTTGSAAPAASSKIPLVTVNSIHPYSGRSWKHVKHDLLTIVGAYGKSTIGLFQPLHEAGVPKNVLQSIALISVSFLDNDDRDDCVEHLSLYFAASKHSYQSKLGCIRILVLLTSPIKACWQLEEGCLKETLNFILDRSQDWAFPEHSEALLIFEMRAKCLRYIELWKQYYRSRVQRVVQGSKVAADSIAGAAKWVERSLKRSVPIIHVGLENTGDQLKGLITPTKSTSQKAHAVASCASVAKSVTAGVRETVKDTADGIRDASVKGIYMAAQKFEDEQIGQKLIRQKDHRDVLMAAGRVGVATFGAAAVVGEAVFETTKSVSRKTVSVTADIVRHKYGDDAGQIVQDGCDATGNVLTTIAHVALLESRVWSKSVAKTAGKTQFRSQYESDDDEAEDTHPIYFLDPTKAEAMAVIRRLQRTTAVLDADGSLINRV